MSVELVGVSHRYGSDPPVLENVSIRFDPGALVAVVGPSGSGKSTLLAIAGLLTQPWRGHVFYDDRRIPSRRVLSRVDRRHVAWIFQNSNLLPRRSAVENTMMGPLSYGSSIRDAQSVAFQALKQVQLGHLSNVPARFLSGGEAQRVGIARALASRPRYLFADEPTGHLDTATTGVVLEALKQRQNEESITIVATHDHTVATACDRIYSMTDGRLSLVM